MKGKDQLGKDTISVVALNDIKRVMTPRMQVCEHLIELKQLEDELLDIKLDIL